MKEFWKSAYNCRSYDQKSSVFWDTVYFIHTTFKVNGSRSSIVQLCILIPRFPFSHFQSTRSGNPSVNTLLPSLYSRRRGYSVQSCDSRLFVRALKGKRLELSTPNFVHVYSIAVARHALTQRSKGQRSRSHGYENRYGRTVASDACSYDRVLLLPAWVCMSIRLPMFSRYLALILTNRQRCKCTPIVFCTWTLSVIFIWKARISNVLSLFLLGTQYWSRTYTKCLFSSLNVPTNTFRNFIMKFRQTMYLDCLVNWINYI